MTRRQVVAALSPVGLIALGSAAQRLGGRAMGPYACIPTMLAFWAAIALLIAGCSPPGSPRRWLGRASGSWAWSALAVAVGLVSLREFAVGFRVLASPRLVILWLAFGLINPWFEEGYWRGLLVDATHEWPLGLGVAYSTAMFALSHPLVWGVHAAALRHPAATTGLAVVGGVWGLAYRKTGSIRWTIVGHGCANLFGLSVPILLNVYVPEGLR